MTGALAGITLALFLSLSSFIVVMLRVSPLISPKFALPFFFLSIFIAITAFIALILSVMKGFLTHQPFRSRRIISSSLRQGLFTGIGTCLIILLWLLHVLNWWIAALVYAVFVLIELAMGR
jgi:hypothetical protein